MKRITSGRALQVLLVVLIVIQFFRIDKTNPPVKTEMDFINITKPSPEVTQILKTSCYDCHSHESVYPWYTNVAPVSWWIKSHINDARRHLNFSEWGSYSNKKADHKLEECIEMTDAGDMPLPSYTLIHSNATLSKQQQHALVTWFKSLRTFESKAEKH